MSTPATVLLLIVACALVAGAVLVLRSRSGLPWPALGLAALTCAVCFTVGGSTSRANESGPDLATLSAAIAGIMTVAAAIVALVPRHEEHPSPSRVPIVIAIVAVLIGAAGLAFTALTS